MKKYEYKVTTIATTIPITTKGYEKIIQEFETKLNELGEVTETSKKHAMELRLANVG